MAEVTEKKSSLDAIKTGRFVASQTGPIAIAGAFSTLLISVITRRYGVELSVDEIGAIITICAATATYILPEPTQG